MFTIRNFIDGAFHDAVSGDRFDKIQKTYLGPEQETA